MRRNISSSTRNHISSRISLSTLRESSVVSRAPQEPTLIHLVIRTNQLGSHQRDPSHLSRLLPPDQRNQAGLGVSQERAASEQAADAVSVVKGEQFLTVANIGAVNHVITTSLYQVAKCCECNRVMNDNTNYNNACPAHRSLSCRWKLLTKRATARKCIAQPSSAHHIADGRYEFVAGETNGANYIG